jgi:hypothetical protein
MTGTYGVARPVVYPAGTLVGKPPKTRGGKSVAPNGCGQSGVGAISSAWIDARDGASVSPATLSANDEMAVGRPAPGGANSMTSIGGSRSSDSAATIGTTRSTRLTLRHTVGTRMQ